jgi:hypothetical protein
LIVRLTSVLASVVAALLLTVTPALASLAVEVADGQSIAGQLHSGTATCTSLSSSDYEHLGEYAIEHMVGWRSVHAAINARMNQMMGSTNADRMHELLGRSYAGCAATGAGTAPTGPGMMSGAGRGVMDWAAMMSSSPWSWMHSA